MLCINRALTGDFAKSLFDITSPVIQECSELGLDQLISSDLVKEIPIVNTICAVIKTGLAIRERHFLEETMRFINVFNAGKIDSIKLQKYKNSIEDTDKLHKEVGRVVLLLDSQVESKQTERLARLYRAYVNGMFDWMKFCELSEVNRRMFESDVKRLMDLSKKIKYSYDYRDSRLASLGLIDASHFDLDERGDIMPNDKSFTVTDLGKILIDIAIIGK